MVDRDVEGVARRWMMGSRAWLGGVERTNKRNVSSVEGGRKLRVELS